MMPDHVYKVLVVDLKWRSLLKMITVTSIHLFLCKPRPASSETAYFYIEQAALCNLCFPQPNQDD